MKTAFQRSTVLAISLLAGFLCVTAYVSAPAAQTTPKAQTSAASKVKASKADAVMGQHSMDGTVTKVDAKRGWVDVKTDEGSMKLHFPSSALQNVKAGDAVTVDIGMTRTSMSKATK